MKERGSSAASVLLSAIIPDEKSGDTAAIRFIEQWFVLFGKRKLPTAN